jgi:hypothetical protein
MCEMRTDLGAAGLTTVDGPFPIRLLNALAVDPAPVQAEQPRNEVVTGGPSSGVMPLGIVVGTWITCDGSLFTGE